MLCHASAFDYPREWYRVLLKCARFNCILCSIFDCPALIRSLILCLSVCRLGLYYLLLLLLLPVPLLLLLLLLCSVHCISVASHTSSVLTVQSRAFSLPVRCRCRIADICCLLHLQSDAWWIFRDDGHSSTFCWLRCTQRWCPCDIKSKHLRSSFVSCPSHDWGELFRNKIFGIFSMAVNFGKSLVFETTFFFIFVSYFALAGKIEFLFVFLLSVKLLHCHAK